MLPIIFFLLAFSAVNCQIGDHFCRRLLERDCTSFPKVPECGTNGVTYINQCDYTQARCRGIDTDIAHKGICTPTSTNQTMPGFNGDQAVLDFLCVQLSHEECPTTIDEVCATDNVTYQNMCEYEKQRCTHRSLHVVNKGVCSAS